jgi:hypothetical protein
MTQHIESMVRAVGGIAEATDFNQLVVARFQNFAKKLYVRNRKTQARKIHPARALLPQERGRRHDDRERLE